MITPHRASVLRMLRYVGPALALLLVFDTAVAVAYVCLGQHWLALPNLPLSIGGGVVGVILGFRNNSCYARWWEARTLWGQIVNSSRCLARQAVTFISAGDTPQDEEEIAGVRRRIVYLQIAYVHALRCQLRGQEPWAELDAILPKGEADSLRGQQNPAADIQRRIAVLLQDCVRRGWLGPVQLGLLDNSLSRLADAQGGCERIKNTPMPKQYDYFPRLLVQATCVLLPLGMVASLGLLTPVGSTLLGFVFRALEKIGRDLEHPFRNSVHDVPLTAICRTIEINLRQCLGETDLPAPVEPADGVLW